MINNIYIHIGVEKTGTTTLQNFFKTNREQLQKQKIVYPKSCGVVGHHKLAFYSASENTLDLKEKYNIRTDKQLKQFMDKLYTQFTNELCKYEKQNMNVLLSSELLSSRVRSISQISRLKGLIEKTNYVPKIIVYLRRQDKMLSSAYYTNIKYGGIPSSIVEMQKTLFRKFDFYNMLEKWSAVFGRNSIVVRVFEKEQMHNGTLIDDFVNILRIDVSDFNVAEVLNKSLGRYEIEFLRYLNQQLITIVGEDNYRHFLPELTEALNGYESEKISFSRNLANDLMAPFIEGNKRIAKEYLGRDDGVLFYEELPPVTDSKLPEINLEKAMEMATRLWVFYKKEKKKLDEIYKKKLDEIYDSTTWKVTKPLRWLMDKLKRIF